MRKMIFAAVAAVCAVANAYVVRVDNLPEITKDCKVMLKSVRTGQTLDSAVATGSRVVLSSNLEPGEWCNVGYAYPVEGGVRTDYVAIFTDCDTITVDVAPGHLEEMVVGGPLNAKNSRAKERMRAMTEAGGRRDASKLLTLFDDEILENADNPYGAYALAMISGIMPDSVWLARFEMLSPSVRDYPNLLKTQAVKRQKMSNSVGKKFSDLSLQTADGKAAKLYDYIGRGKYVLVDFWASWCGPCRHEAKNTLMPMYEKYKNDDRFMIIGVITSEEPESAISTAKNSAYPWLQVIDIDRKAPATFGFSTIPQIMLIGPDGTLLYRGIRGQAIFDAVGKSFSK